MGICGGTVDEFTILSYAHRMPEPKSIQYLLRSAIDYAGTFPPARLSLQKALKEASDFQTHSSYWWLSTRMALLVQDLQNLDHKKLETREGTAMAFTAIASRDSSINGEAFLKSVQTDLNWLQKFKESSSPHRVNAYEIKLPQQKDLEGLLMKVRRAYIPEMADVQPIFEIGFSEPWNLRLDVVAKSLSEWITDKVHPAVKLRTGGEKVPDPEILSNLLSTCASQGLAIKATQGLHGAITHGGSYGFINLLTSIHFHWALQKEGFGREQIGKMLRDENPKSFHFDDAQIAWGKYRLNLEAIQATKKDHRACFGSCSLREPEHSLKLFLSTDGV